MSSRGTETEGDPVQSSSINIMKEWITHSILEYQGVAQVEILDDPPRHKGEIHARRPLPEVRRSPMIILGRLADEQDKRGNYEIATHYRNALEATKERLRGEE